MPRESRKYIPIVIEVHPRVHRMIKKLVQQGLYGVTIPDVAERLVNRSLIQIFEFEKAEENKKRRAAR